MKKLILICLVAMQLFGDCSEHLESAKTSEEKADKHNEKGKIDLVNAYHIITNLNMLKYQNCLNDEFKIEIRGLMKDIDSKLLNLSIKASSAGATNTSVSESTNDYGTGY